MKARALASFAAIALAACGPAGVSLDTSSPDAVADALVSLDTNSDVAVPDAMPSTDAPEPDAAVEPQRCATGAACNRLLDADGRCPGACVALSDRTACSGEIAYGLCFGDPPARAPRQSDVDGLRVETLVAPTESRVGDTSVFTLRLTNTSTTAAVVRARPTVGDAWVTVASNFAELETLTLAPGAHFDVTATLRATRATVFAQPQWPALFFGAERQLHVVQTPVGYADGALSCGARSFPQRFDGDDRPNSGYVGGRCCDAVFYPSAQCCTSSDCARGGACIDGVCVASAPTHSTAGTPLAGPLRILVVLSDRDERETDVCRDRTDALRAELGLDDVSDYYRALVRARSGRTDFAIQWTVLSGVRSDGVVPADSYFPLGFGRAVERHLVERGCFASIDAAFDRVLHVSPRIEIGALGGVAYDVDRAALHTASPFVIAHELGHTFGGDDLYVSMGSYLQHAGALMSWNFGDRRTDQVLWGQAGFADIDHDGVLDFARFVQDPERIVLKSLTARVVRSGGVEALYVTPVLRGVSQGVEREVAIATYQIELPAHGFTRRMARGDLAMFANAGDVNLDAIERAGVLRVRVRVEHHYTREDFTRGAVSLDETREVPVAVERGLRAP